MKENVRFVGYDNKRGNYSVLDLSGENFEITPNTYIQFRIDDMFINEQPPSPPETTNAYQFLSFEFSDGTAIQVSVDGQGVWVNSLTQYYNFWKEYIWRGNIYNLLQKNQSAPSPIFLEKISLIQELDSLADPSTIQHEQYMKIDSIRLWEAVPK